MYLERISLFFFLNPSFSLSLGIYEEGISCCFCDNDAILHRQIISWESLKVPLAYLQYKTTVRLITCIFVQLVML